MRSLILALLLATPAFAQAPPPDAERARWAKTAAGVTIVRDDFGIAHVAGRTDADAVFGMIYAQAEDDFPRVETNYINALGRLAETEGEAALFRDLRMRLWIDPEDLQARHAGAPDWLRALTQAWADALNFYLATHAQVKPRVITRFEPWMALAFSEGSIGADYEGVSIPGVAAFYGRIPEVAAASPDRLAEPAGSNGFAIAPSHSIDGKALLLINPHTSFYFRSEAQVRSGDGLGVYGASTWGQFFVYQGFNDHLGWMHTSSGVDTVDEFGIDVRKETDGSFSWRDGGNWRPFDTRAVTLRYRRPDGTMAARTFTTWSTSMGPVTRAEGRRWIATGLMFKPVEALQQSYLRTKANTLSSYLQVAKLRANSSNNTLVATDEGRIAYLHPQFVPVRDPRFDYTKPVDGSDPATRWRGEHDIEEVPQVIDPANGWAMNVNNRPWTAAGADSPKADRFPKYMDQAGENAREDHAIAVLTKTPKFSLDSLLEAAYDPHMTAFAQLVPTLLAAFDRLPAGDPRRAALAAPVASLRSWDHRTGEASVPMSLAVMWGEALATRFTAAADGDYLIDYLTTVPTDAERLAAFGDAVARLTKDFGRWATPWGEINRLQRQTGDLVQLYDDARPSLPIGMASANWGALASFGADPSASTKRRYGSYGNSFVAVVEFGPKVRARAISVGGQNSDPAGPHFFDQAERYRTHDFRKVYLTGDDLTGHVVRRYSPGELP
jgi:acyl-homoserine-lactone acylase